MNGIALRPSLPLAPILPPSLRKWAQPIEPAVNRLLIPDRVMRAFDAVGRVGDGAEFARRFLNQLDIRVAIEPVELQRIPASGPVMVVANHPFGIVEGLALTAILDRVRPDLKIVANSILGGIEEMRHLLILVNPFEGPEAVRQNFAPLRSAFTWMARGGMLVIFPGGEVASLNWKEHSVTDPPWKTTAARLAQQSRSPVVPLYFAGSNSVPFHLAGALHPVLRTLSLAHEFAKLSGKTIRLRAGHPITPNLLSDRDADQATEYLRSRVFFLANRTEHPVIHQKTPLGTTVPVEQPESEELLAEEVAALPPACDLAGNGEFTVYLANASAIPRMLREIGRCRELAFRNAGEGTGCHTDLDRFDRHYEHLFLWSRKDCRLAGAYRMAVTTDVLPRFGVSGLYTGTLFHFHREFFHRIGPAVELGRSFVMPAFQKNYACLLLLWKGITRAIERRPEAPVLFGAVSISNDYLGASRGLIAHYLSSRSSHELARFVRPRNRFRDPSMRNPQIKRFANLAADIEDVSLSIADIEDDAKGVPVLLRQYLRAGGRLLGFNLDSSFSDALDALIVADLRTAPLALLERCMGRAEARAFLALHVPKLQ